MLHGVLVLSIARGVIEHRRRCVTAKGRVVTDIRPDAPRHRLALGQDRHGRIVAMQSFGSQDLALDQRMKAVAGPSCRRRPGWPASTRSDRCLRACSVRSGGSTADAGRTSQTGSWAQQVWSGEAARRDMERRWRLRDLLALPAPAATSGISPTKYDTFKRAG